MTNEVITVTSITSSPVCPQANVQYWTDVNVLEQKNIFDPTGAGIQGTIQIKVETTNTPVLTGSIARQMVAQILTDEGYQTEESTQVLRDVIDSDLRKAVISSYRVICADP